MSSQWPTQQHIAVRATSSRPAPSPVPEPMRPIVFVVDEDASAREALEALIRSAGWHPQSFATGQDFLEHSRLAVPSCLVLDVALPDLDGLDVQKRIAGACACMPLVFVTGQCDVPTAVRAMKEGAVDLLTKPVHAPDLLRALGDALERSRTLLLREAEMSVLRARFASLTGREREVMALVVAGLLNKQVGGELGICEETVKAHRGHLMRKMQARSIADLVKMATKICGD